MLISGYLNRLKHLQDIEDEAAFAFWTRNDIFCADQSVLIFQMASSRRTRDTANAGEGIGMFCKAKSLVLWTVLGSGCPWIHWQWTFCSLQPCWSTTVRLYDGMLQVFLSTFPNHGRKLNVTENLLASGVAVVGATVCTHPIDVVKVQLQMAEKSCAKADSFSHLAAMASLVCWDWGGELRIAWIVLESCMWMNETKHVSNVRKGGMSGMADVSQACGVLLAFGRSSKDVREQAWSCGGSCGIRISSSWSRLHLGGTHTLGPRLSHLSLMDGDSTKVSVTTAPNFHTNTKGG